MSNNPLRLHGIDFMERSAETLAPETWKTVYALEARAFRDALPSHSRSEIDTMLGYTAEGLDHFAATRAQPELLAEEGTFPNLSFRDPTVALAWRRGELIGYAYAANTASGNSELLRAAKLRGLFGIDRKHAWLREIAVTPEEQGKGIGTMLGALVFMSKYFPAAQPTSAYTWPGESAAGDKLLPRLGMRRLATTVANPFGSDEASGLVVQQSWRGTVGGVKQALFERPDGLATYAAIVTRI